MNSKQINEELVNKDCKIRDKELEALINKIKTTATSVRSSEIKGANIYLVNALQTQVLNLCTRCTNKYIFTLRRTLIYIPIAFILQNREITKQVDII